MEAATATDLHSAKQTQQGAVGLCGSPLCAAVFYIARVSNMNVKSFMLVEVLKF